MPPTGKQGETKDKEEVLPRQLRRLNLKQHDTFLENWNPETSNREARKMTRKNYSQRRYLQHYDENGIHVGSGLDACDCMVEDCAGCHYPCPKCGSLKCGHECRKKRRWLYDTLEVEGTDVIIKNYLKQV